MTYSIEFRRAVAAAYEECGSSIEVAEQFQCSQSWVRRLVQRQLETGSLEPLPPKRPDNRKLDAQDLTELRKLIEQKPDAVVCCNDLVALGAYDTLAAAGLRIPKDICVTGHNDMQLVDLISPALTTIRPPLRELGWRAAQLLFERLDGLQLSPAAVVLPPELVVRESTR
jgi:DNA-binding LacI/PurR family transcriptional regulator